jgi:hypothetical protein
MNRIEIEIKLNRDRAWLLETYAAMTPAELEDPVTPSEHDPESTWTVKDHLVHLALIEFNWNRMVRDHIGGDRHAVRLPGLDGPPSSREAMMAAIHAWTEEWQQKHRAASLDEVVAVGQRARGESLSLLAELTDEQLASRIPGAPWADGTVGAILAANADHGRMHFNWVKDARAAR